MSVTEDKLRDLRAQIERNERKLSAMTATPSIADANEIGEAWTRWDSLYQALGDQTPRAYPGEKPRAYLRRLADGVKKFTETFKNYAFHDSIQSIDLGLVTDRIFAEAMAKAKSPATFRPGVMREVVTVQHGKTRTEFIGDSRTAFGPFMHPRKFCVVKINTPGR
jgi:hypothetical protein